MPINIFEQQDLTTVNVEGEFMPKLHSKYINIVQPLIDDETYTLVLYAGSAQELLTAIADKKADVNAYFETLHGITYQQATKNENAAQPALTLSAATLTNLAKADAAKAVVEGLVDKAAVIGYDETTTPAWV